ncbi:AAA family ATPase, partial [Neobacillus drentensis]|uniref:AAA family ATPase n=1 Tax=Neobacillus drentensis TaxID=220684 RepID=UPI002FFF504A
MSRKIKRVEIESFRAYEEKEIFDMSISDDIANLVVIYAPNGSGKTSFFDAIEWALSGEIRRISNNTRVKEIAELEKGYILKNKYSHLTTGSVEINFSDDKKLKISTRELKGNRKTDYKPGINLYKNTEIQNGYFQDFINKNLLTHDQVDKFLRFQNSRERYEALKVFWDFNDETSIYTNLAFILQEIEIGIKDVNEKIREVEVDLEKYQLDNKLLLSLNEKISSINESSDKRSKIEILDGQTKNAEIVLKQAITKKSINEEFWYKLNYQSKDIHFLLENFQSFSNKLTELERNQELLNKLIKTKESMELFQTKESTKEEIIINLNSLESRLNDITFLLTHHQEVKEIEKKQNNLKNDKNVLLEELELISRQIINVEETLSKNNDLISNKKLELNNFSIKQKKVNEFLRYIGLNEKRLKLESEMEFISNELDVNQK